MFDLNSQRSEISEKVTLLRDCVVVFQRDKESGSGRGVGCRDTFRSRVPDFALP